MVKLCCVKGCRSQCYANCEISFHVFPRDPQLRAKWMEVVGNVTSKNPVICSRHFKLDDYRLVGPHVPSLGTGNRLKEGAVPFIVSETPPVVSQDSDDSMISDISDVSEENEEDNKLLDMFVSAARPPLPKKMSHFGVNCQLPNPKEQKLKLEIRGLNQKLRRRDLAVKRLQKVLRDIRAKINASSLLNNTQEIYKTTRNTNTSFKPQITIIHKVVGGKKH